MILKKIRLHQPLLHGIEEALEKIFGQGKKSDQVVPSILKAHPKWGSRDRNFVAENTYEIVRNKRLLRYILEETEGSGEESGMAMPDITLSGKGGPGVEVPGVDTLGIETSDMTTTGADAAGIIPLYRKMTGAWLILKGFYEEENAYFDGLDPDKIRERAAVSAPEIRFSVPDSLSSLVRKELGDERWYRELEAMSAPADVFLRVNLHRIPKAKLKAELEEKGIFTDEVESVETALKLVKRSNLTLTEEFRKGYFEIQDAGSQLISPFLGPQPGELVIDACAGAGGKTLHLADLMKNRGRLLALDVETTKLKELETRAQRNRVGIVTTRGMDPDVITEFYEQADKLLLDVPCSGLGVIRRNPDAKEALTADFLEEIKGVQAEILKNYSRMVKPGGMLVYATCSVLPSENREQVDRFLAENSGYTLIDDRQIWPSESGFDGFYMALIRKE